MTDTADVITEDEMHDLFGTPPGGSVADPFEMDPEEGTADEQSEAGSDISFEGLLERETSYRRPAPQLSTTPDEPDIHNDTVSSQATQATEDVSDTTSITPDLGTLEAQVAKSARVPSAEALLASYRATGYVRHGSAIEAGIDDDIDDYEDDALTLIDTLREEGFIIITIYND